MTLDLTKPVQTRDGRKARILATDINCEWPIAAVIKMKGDSDHEIVKSYRIHGRIFDCCESFDDLVNAPERVSRWFNIYPKDAYPRDREEANRIAYRDQIAMIEIVYDGDNVVDIIKHDLEPK